MDKKVLLVEDDRFLIDLYTELLKEEGYTVEIAPDGLIGEMKLKLGNWDLVLLDNYMPKKSGLQIIASLSKEEIHGFTKKLLFLTNSDSKDDIEKASLVCDGIIIKSEMSPDAFLIEVKKYIAAD